VLFFCHFFSFTMALSRISKSVAVFGSRGTIGKPFVRMLRDKHGCEVHIIDSADGAADVEQHGFDAIFCMAGHYGQHSLTQRACVETNRKIWEANVFAPLAAAHLAASSLKDDGWLCMFGCGCDSCSSNRLTHSMAKAAQEDLFRCILHQRGLRSGDGSLFTPCTVTNVDVTEFKDAKDPVYSRAAQVCPDGLAEVLASMTMDATMRPPHGMQMLAFAQGNTNYYKHRNAADFTVCDFPAASDSL
jgi:hypothetical protein